MKELESYEGRLLSGSKKIMEQNEQLNNSMSLLNDTTDMAENSLERLIVQGEQIINITNNVDDLNNNIYRSNRIIRMLEWNEFKSSICKVFLVLIGSVIIILLILFIMYITYRKYYIK